MYYFYCTTKINNHYKVGIADSISNIKGRLTSYRSSNPNTEILFFSEIFYGKAIEESFKRKFDYFRIGKSECYKLKSDIIYKHFLKYQHTNQCLHYFWGNNTFYLSDYYFTKELYDGGYNLTQRIGRAPYQGFTPMAQLDYVYNKNKEEYKYKDGSYKIILIYLNLNKIKLSDYNKLYKKHLSDKYYGKKIGYADEQLNLFFKNNFELNKIFRADEINHTKVKVFEIIYNHLKNNKFILKKYPEKKEDVRWWQRDEYKSIRRIKSLRLIRKIEYSFEELYNEDQIIGGLRRLLNRNHDPQNWLRIFNRIISTSFKTPEELKPIFEKLETEIPRLVKYYNNKEKIDFELSNKKEKNENENDNNVLDFIENLKKIYKKKKIRHKFAQH